MGKLSLRQWMECGVCGQVWDEQDAVETRQLVRLFGAGSWFVQCCCCGQAVDDWEDPVYQRRWIKWARRLVKQRKLELKTLMDNERANDRVGMHAEAGERLG